MHNYMKHLITCVRSILLLIAVTVSVAVRAEEGVILHLKDGNEVSFVFSSRPKLMMGTELQISTIDGYQVSYDYLLVSRVSFGEATATGVEEVSTVKSKVVFSLSEDKVLVEGLKVGESASVYNLAGQLLISVKQTLPSGPLTLPLTEKGVLIVRMSTGVNYKLMSK